MHTSFLDTDRATPTRPHVSCLLICLLACLSPWADAAIGNAEEIPASGDARFALLVGVEQYPNLAAHEQLAGCVNDTQIMKSLLTQRFGFQESGIVTLTDEAATGDAIRREFRNLVERVRSLPPDGNSAQIVFHFSGHGSQVVDQQTGDPDVDEQDGLDETLVPFDATKQGGPEDIRDDEVFAFVEQLCENDKTKVWLILDCCHSGTGARGATRFRSLERGSALPLEVQPEENRRVTAKRLPAGAMLLSACRSTEKEPEYQEGTQSYGLLTRFVAQVLNQEQAVSRLSYEALRESLVVDYRQAGISQAPTPQLEGVGRNIVLSADASSDRQPFWKVVSGQQDRSVATLQAGTLHGISAGSLFELYERPDQISEPRVSPDDVSGKESSLAWLSVERVNGVSAAARVFRWQKDEQVPAALPTGFKEGYAVERHHEHGSFVLRVRVVRALNEHQDGPALAADDLSIPAVVRETLSRGRGDDNESRWLEWVAGDGPCDVLLRIAGDNLAVFPASGKNVMTPEELMPRRTVADSLRGGWGPIGLRATDASQKLQDMLRQINRVRNLQSIAAISPESSPGQPQVKLELVEIEVANEVAEDYTVTSERPWRVSKDENGQESFIMHNGALYAVRVTNLESPTSGRPVYVTVLRIDADMGIGVLLPVQEGATEEQKILPGESQLSALSKCNAPDEEAPIYGLRTATVLATREPNDFYILASPSLPMTRGTAGLANRALNELLVEQTYFRTRGDKPLRPSKTTDNSWSSATIQWIVQP